MGEVSGRSVGDAFVGESTFVSEDNRANLEEALEAAAAAAAGSIAESPLHHGRTSLSPASTSAWLV